MSKVMLQEMLWGIVVVLLAVVLVMLGTATKLKTARNIKLQGAVSGNANFDGSENITINTIQNNIVMLTGSINTIGSQGSTSEEGSANINYPQGFNINNSVVISIAAQHSSRTNMWGYGITENSLGILTGTIQKSVVLKENNIAINLKVDWGTILNEDKNSTYNYKIILMKIE